MELNFDKEIDAILRKTQPVSSAGGFFPHLDPDEISAFAENSLPENAKMRCTAHLADCERCRKILSNLILLGAEPASEIVHAEQTAPAIPWYRKLFIFPNFAYSLGALALVFGALIVFTIIQSADRNGEVSQLGDTFNKSSTQPAAANANVSSAPAANISTANAPATDTEAANPGIVTQANKPVGAPNVLPKSASNVSREEDYCRDCGTPTQQEKIKPGNKEVPKDQPLSSDDASGAGKVTNDKRADTVKNEADEAKLKTERAAPSVGGLGDVAATKQARKKVNEKSDSQLGETTKVGGKTFRREGAAWVDSVYQRGANLALPSLTYVSRGSSEYKKLDGDLKRIAEKLNGVVIVVWKGKAYRIQ